MRSRSVAAGAVLVALVLAAPALAQRQGGPGGFGGFGAFARGGGGGYLGLLQIEEVRKEVELLDDQWAQIQKIGEEARNARGEGQRFDFRGFQDLSEEERAKRLAELREQQEKRTKEINAKVEEVLLPHQTERLKQLSIQQQGARALANPEVVAALKLTDEQQEKIRNVIEERTRSGFGGFGRGNRDNQQGERPNFEEIRTRMREAQAQMEKETLAVLTDEQKKQFEEMKGEPFTFPEPQFGGFGGRRGDGERGEGRRGDDRPQRQRPESDN